MIKNFDEIKRQLKELSEVVNAFKSEAVQLRLVELIFGAADREPDGDGDDHENTPLKKRRSRRAAKPAKNGGEASIPSKAKSGGRTPRSGSRLGARGILTKLQESGYFKKPHTIKDIVQHAETNLATKVKQSDLSGPLARYIRDEKLKRAKNSDNQYEYIEA